MAKSLLWVGVVLGFWFNCLFVILGHGQGNLPYIMRNYELTIVLVGKVTPAKKKSVSADVEKLIKTAGGKITDTEDWGAREFAYEIKDERSGTYLHFKLELDPQSAKGLDSKLNLEESIARYLLVREEAIKKSMKVIKKGESASA